MSQRPTAEQCHRARELVRMAPSLGEAYYLLDGAGLFPVEITRWASTTERRVRAVNAFLDRCPPDPPDDIPYLEEIEAAAVDMTHRRPYCAGVVVSALVVVLGWCVLAWVFGPLFGVWN